MGDPARARRIDDVRLRRALSRVLVPELVAKVLDEATVDERPPVVAPTAAQLEAEIRRQDERSRLRGKG